jgi:hypothetical protein
MPTSIIFSSELTFLMAAARRSPGAALAVIVGLAIVPIGVLHHLFSMLFSRDPAGAPSPGPPESFTLTHAVVAVELALLFGGGVFFLSTPGFEWAASIARAFTVYP